MNDPFENKETWVTVCAVLLSKLNVKEITITQEDVYLALEKESYNVVTEVFSNGVVRLSLETDKPAEKVINNKKLLH